MTFINVFHTRKCWRKEAHGQEPNQTNSFKDLTTKKIKAQCMSKNFALSFTATNHDFGKNKMDMSIIQSKALTWTDAFRMKTGYSKVVEAEDNYIKITITITYSVQSPCSFHNPF